MYFYVNHIRRKHAYRACNMVRLWLACSATENRGNPQVWSIQNYYTFRQRRRMTHMHSLSCAFTVPIWCKQCLVVRHVSQTWSGLSCTCIVFYQAHIHILTHTSNAKCLSNVTFTWYTRSCRNHCTGQGLWQTFTQLGYDFKGIIDRWSSTFIFINKCFNFW